MCVLESQCVCVYVFPNVLVRQVPEVLAVAANPPEVFNELFLLNRRRHCR